MVSLVPIHLASFVFSIPSSLRLFLDPTFKVSFSLSFFSNVVFVGFLARYLPLIVFGMISWVYNMIVESIYYRRGYRRIYVAFTGFGKKARRLNSSKGYRECFQEISVFRRGNARLANLIKNNLQRKMPIEFYNTWRLQITIILGLMFFYANLHWILSFNLNGFDGNAKLCSPDFL